MVRTARLSRALNRRRLLAGAIRLLLGAGIVERGASSLTTFADVPGAPPAFLSTRSVSQGGAVSIRVRADYAGSASATLDRATCTLVREGRYLVGILPAGQTIADEAEIEPGEYDVSVDADTPDGPARVNLQISVAATAFPVDAVDLPPSTAALLDPTLVDRETAILAGVYGAGGGPARWRGLFRMPVSGPITTEFGQARSYNGGPVSGHHSGVDIGAAQGTPVAAAADGAVAFAGTLSERGNMVILGHGLGVFTGYAHLSQIGVATGDQVRQGDVLGLVGTTGLSTGPHLHWECAVNGLNVDAMHWLRTLLP